MGWNILWCGRILWHVSWMNNILDGKWMANKMDELSNQHWQRNYFCKKLNKRNMIEFSCWFILKNMTHEMLMQYFKLYVIFPWYELMQHLNHLNFWTKSNSVVYKLVDQLRGMCQSIHYPITTERHVPIRIWDHIWL
jgi:hypothetical protein